MLDWNSMKFIEMTGATLDKVINDGELHGPDFAAAGISETSIVRVNLHGDIEVRREDKWDVIGGLLGDFDERLRKTTGLNWA